MAIVLEGGTCVSNLDEGTPDRLGNLSIRRLFGRATGARAISLRVIVCGEPGGTAAGTSPGLTTPGSDETLYVIAGRGTAWVDGHAFPVETDTGLFLASGSTLTLRSEGEEPLALIGALCPDPEEAQRASPPLTEPPAGDSPPRPAPVVRLADVPRQRTSDRWYCEIIDPKVGSLSITQFVGSIPPGRAPDHFHRYEEVLVILAGAGRMWAGATQAPIAAGSCIFLPHGQVHCVENTGPGAIRLLGMFYPAGSPAVRYDPDGAA